VSLILAGVGAAAYPALQHGSVERWLVLQLMISNLGVMVFNMLPGLPLDGGRLLRAGVWRITRSQVTGTKAAAWSGRGIAVVIVAGAVALWYGNRDGRRIQPAAVTLIACLCGPVRPSAAAGDPSGDAAGVADFHADPPRAAGDHRPVGGRDRAPAHEARAGAVVLVDSDQRPRSGGVGGQRGRRSGQPAPWTSIADVARPLERV